MIAEIVGFLGMDIGIEKHDIILLRGPNGSGKTSLLRALAGLTAPIAPLRVDRRGSVAYAPQDARDALVGLTVGGEFRLRNLPPPIGLAALAERASVELSSGETRRVALATCEGVDLLLLDEPAEGLDPEGRATLRALILRTAARGGAVVVADHGHDLETISTKIVDLAPTRRAPLPAIPHGSGAPILVAEPATVRGRQLPALALGPGFHVLRGASGSGKSSLLMRLAGLLGPRGVFVAGEAPRPGANVRLLLPHARDHLTRDEVSQECPASPLVPEALRSRHPLALSGGEAQRVALAKTFGVAAPVILLDEPEAHLDEDGRALLVDEIALCVKQGACVLAATHDDLLAAIAQSEVRL